MCSPARLEDERRVSGEIATEMLHTLHRLHTMTLATRETERASIAARLAPLTVTLRAAQIRIDECEAAGDRLAAGEIRWSVMVEHQRANMLSRMLELMH